VIVEVTGVLAYSRLENQLELSTASGPGRLQASSFQKPLFDLEGDVMVGVFFFFLVLLDFGEDLKGISSGEQANIERFFMSRCASAWWL